MIRYFILAATVIFSVNGLAQIPSASSIEDSVLNWSLIFRGENDELKEARAQQMEDSLAAFFSVDSNFNHQFDTLRFLGQLTSDDGKLRIITFNYPRTDGTFGYHCLILHRANAQDAHRLFTLKDDQGPWERLEFKTLDPKNWYGALYYRIVQKRHKKSTYYTLIGWDGHDQLSNRKVIDVLDVSGTQPRFGSPIFLKDGRAQNRLIFEYANDASMALNFQENEGMIVMDHLAPEHPRLKGQFQFYGPDFSYDALKFKKGKWHLIEDHNAENRSLNGLPKDRKPGDFQD